MLKFIEFNTKLFYLTWKQLPNSSIKYLSCYMQSKETTMSAIITTRRNRWNELWNITNYLRTIWSKNFKVSPKSQRNVLVTEVNYIHYNKQDTSLLATIELVTRIFPPLLAKQSMYSYSIMLKKHHSAFTVNWERKWDKKSASHYIPF